MLSGTESDRLNCALSLPLLTSNKSLLRKLLLDGGGLQFALRPLGGDTDSDQTDPAQKRSPDLPLRSLYCPLLVGCLSALAAGSKPSNKTLVSLQPPPKKPRLDQSCCPYESASSDLVFLLDDGVEIPANRGAVSGEEAGSSGSEYFRALLRGGFDEARGKDVILIRDVSAGTLTPVLHFLHGCRFSIAASCPSLEAVVNEGISRNFEKTALGEAMIGACRFLVGDLQKELEDVCISLINSEMGTRDRNPSPSDLETETPVCETPKRKHGDTKDESLEESGSRPSVLDLLPEIYWFSQRHSLGTLGRSCLSVLTAPRCSQAEAGACLRRLAAEADCVEALRRDLLTLVMSALS